MYRVIWFYEGGNVPQHDSFPNEKVAHEFVEALKKRNTASNIIGPFEEKGTYLGKNKSEWTLTKR